MQKAVQFTKEEEGLEWDGLQKYDSDMNAWLFIKEDDIRETVKAFRNFNDGQAKKIPKDR